MLLTTWREFVRSHDLPLDSWYPHAAICAVPLAAETEGPTPGATTADRLLASVDELQSLGVTCLRLLPPESGTARLDLQRVLTAAHCRHLRVLLDTARQPARDPDEWHGQLRTGERWLRRGMDAVVMPPPVAGLDVREAARLKPSGRWLAVVDGMPVPLDAQHDVLELGFFRSALVETLFESLRRENSIPLLGLMIRLTLRIVRRAQDAPGIDGRHEPNADPVANLPHPLLDRLRDDHRSLQLIERLLLSLPGPPQLVFPDDVALGRHVTVARSLAWTGQQPLSHAIPKDELALAPDDVGTLLLLRQATAALTHGIASPVAVGGGAGVAFVREWQGEVVLVVGNLSGRSLEVECDLNGYQGRHVVDMIEGETFDEVLDARYLVSLAPYACHWLRLARSTAGDKIAPRTR